MESAERIVRTGRLADDDAHHDRRTVGTRRVVALVTKTAGTRALIAGRCRGRAAPRLRGRRRGDPASVAGSAASRRLALVLAPAGGVAVVAAADRGDPVDSSRGELPDAGSVHGRWRCCCCSRWSWCCSARRSEPGRSPHITFRPEQIGVTLDDVKGVDAVKEDVVRSLNLFLAHRTFTRRDGRDAAARPAVRGAAGHRQDAHGQGDGPRGRGAVPVRVGDVVPVDVLRRDGPQDPLLLPRPAQGRPARRRSDRLHRGDRRDRHDPAGACPRCPRRLPGSRSAHWSPGCSLGASCGWSRRADRAIRRPQPSGRPVDASAREPAAWSTSCSSRCSRSTSRPAASGSTPGSSSSSTHCCRPTDSCPGPYRRRRTCCVIAATNRADNLDPALLRPGRFDRRLTFDPPGRRARRELVDHFLASKAHAPELDRDEAREQLAAMTQSYTPVMIEHLLDEALVNALRRGGRDDDDARRRAGPADRGDRSRPTGPVHRAGADA